MDHDETPPMGRTLRFGEALGESGDCARHASHGANGLPLDTPRPVRAS